MNSYWLLLTTSFALFSMFFGSGNLVFPITVGFESEGHYLLGSLGIILTGVAVPFLGVFGMMLFQGETNAFFKLFGRKGILLFSFLSLALMGPFGVLARCLTVAHGALLLIVPSATLPVTSFCLCLLIFLLAYNKTKVISLLGSALTPFLLLSIAAIVYFGVTNGSFGEASENTFSSLNAFQNGFFQGYQTMDLLAAFFFSQFVIKHLLATAPKEWSNRETMSLFCKSSLLAAGLLSSVYFCLVVLGAIYAPLLTNTAPQEMLGVIAMQSLGAFAAPCVCVAIIFACLTTAIVLTSLFAEFLRKDLCQEKLNNGTSIFITLTIGFLVSTLEFSGIAKFLGPLLEMVYPALIVLTIGNIVYYYVRKKSEA